MKKILITAILLIPFLNINPQGIGENAPQKPPMVFPSKAWGLDLMVGESGFGLGGFYRFKMNNQLSFFTDISFSEAKDDREFEYIDFYGNTYTVGKENRIFQVPVNIGAQYRIFANELTDNLRPYINAGVGPAIVITTPYNKEFFKAFSDAQFRIAVGGYIGFGANFGLDTSNLIGLNFRYYYIQFFDHGVSSLTDRPKSSIGGFFVTINFGFMHD